MHSTKYYNNLKIYDLVALSIKKSVLVFLSVEDKANRQEAQKCMNLCAYEKIKYFIFIKDLVFHFQKIIMALHKKSIEQGDKVGV